MSSDLSSTNPFDGVPDPPVLQDGPRRAWLAPGPRRSVPFPEGSERAVLGGAMIASHLCRQMLSELKPDDFYPSGHQILARLMADLQQRGGSPKPVNRQAILAEVERLGISQLGERGELEAELRAMVEGLDASEWVLAFPGHLQQVKNASQIRRLQKKLTDVLQATESGEWGEELILRAEREVLSVTRSVQIRDARATMPEILEDLEAHYQERDQHPNDITGLCFGIRSLDRRTNGVQSGEVSMVAAPPGAGKSGMLLRAALHNAETFREAGGKERVLYFSLEMSKRQLMNRAVGHEARIDTNRLDAGILTPEERGRRALALGRIRSLPLTIDDQSDLTVSRLLGIAHREKADRGLGLVIVDYFSLVRADKETANELRDQAEVAKALKRGAKELGVPILLAEQTRKQDQGRRNRFNLDDVIGSRAISAAMGLVVLIQEKDAEVNPLEPREKLANVTKNRYGGEGTVRVWWTPQHVRFDEVTGPARAEEQPKMPHDWM